MGDMERWHAGVLQACADLHARRYLMAMQKDAGVFRKTSASFWKDLCIFCGNFCFLVQIPLLSLSEDLCGFFGSLLALSFFPPYRAKENSGTGLLWKPVPECGIEYLYNIKVCSVRGNLPSRSDAYPLSWPAWRACRGQRLWRGASEPCLPCGFDRHAGWGGSRGVRNSR